MCKLSVLLACSFLLFSCGSQPRDAKEKSADQEMPQLAPAGEQPVAGGAGKLEGAWEIVRAEGAMSSVNVGTVYTFRGDQLSFGKEGFLNPGRTEITDSTFSFQAEGTEYRFMYDYRMKGDTLVVEMQNSNGQVFYMFKK